MVERLEFPPIPGDRPGKYLWIAEVAAMGLKIKDACVYAGVPRISYYKYVNRKAKKEKAA